MKKTVPSPVNSGILPLSKAESRASAARHRPAVMMTCGSVRALGAGLGTLNPKYPQRPLWDSAVKAFNRPGDVRIVSARRDG